MANASPAEVIRVLTDAYEREITWHYVAKEERIVIFEVKYASSADQQTILISEKNLQGIDEPLVLNYWAKKSGQPNAGGLGRDAVTGLRNDTIFKILKEWKEYWLVQWVGYPTHGVGTTVVQKDVIARKCPEAIVKWRNSLSREELFKVQDYDVGIDLRKGIPRWVLGLPKIDKDDLTEDEKGRLEIL